MARKRIDQFKLLAATGLIVLGWLVLHPAIKSFLRVSFYEFQAPVWKVSSYVTDLQDYWAMRGRSKRELIEAARDLARENASHYLTQHRNEALEKEVLALESMMNLPSLPEYRNEVARVARRDINAWWQRLIIRKGADYKIPVGAAVISREGVVGRIREVRAYTSVVELVSSDSFRMAAVFQGDLRPVTYQGSLSAPFSGPIGDVSNVPPDIRTSEDEPGLLISSGLGGVFPKGLPIGKVYEMAPGSDGLFYQGAVILPESLHNLSEVAVLIPVQADVAEAITLEHDL